MYTIIIKFLFQDLIFTQGVVYPYTVTVEYVTLSSTDRGTPTEIVVYSKCQCKEVTNKLFVMKQYQPYTNTNYVKYEDIPMVLNILYTKFSVRKMTSEYKLVLVLKTSTRIKEGNVRHIMETREGLFYKMATRRLEG